MLIQGKLTHLVPFTQSHLDDSAYYQWLSDTEVVRYIGRNELLDGITFSDAEDYVKQLWANHYCTFLAVHDNESSKFIGTAKVNFITDLGRKYGIADIGIMLGERDFWGRGVATDILRSISVYAFDHLNARKLSAGAFSLNVAVVKAFIRIGYQIDGSLRQQLRVGDGYCDHVLLSCFEHELIRDSQC
jgi:ribosomal-protein-alanine N-acetyltransferase